MSTRTKVNILPYFNAERLNKQFQRYFNEQTGQMTDFPLYLVYPRLNQKQLRDTQHIYNTNLKFRKAINKRLWETNIYLNSKTFRNVLCVQILMKLPRIKDFILLSVPSSDKNYVRLYPSILTIFMSLQRPTQPMIEFSNSCKKISEHELLNSLLKTIGYNDLQHTKGLVVIKDLIHSSNIEDVFTMMNAIFNRECTESKDINNLNLCADNCVYYHKNRYYAVCTQISVDKFQQRKHPNQKFLEKYLKFLVEKVLVETQQQLPPHQQQQKIQQQKIQAIEKFKYRKSQSLKQFEEPTSFVINLPSFDRKIDTKTIQETIFRKVSRLGKRLDRGQFAFVFRGLLDNISVNVCSSVCVKGRNVFIAYCETGNEPSVGIIMLGKNEQGVYYNEYSITNHGQQYYEINCQNPQYPRLTDPNDIDGAIPYLETYLQYADILVYGDPAHYSLFCSKRLAETVLTTRSYKTTFRKPQVSITLKNKNTKIIQTCYEKLLEKMNTLVPISPRGDLCYVYSSVISLTMAFPECSYQILKKIGV